MDCQICLKMLCYNISDEIIFKHGKYTVACVVFIIYIYIYISQLYIKARYSVFDQS